MQTFGGQVLTCCPVLPEVSLFCRDLVTTVGVQLLDVALILDNCVFIGHR